MLQSEQRSAPPFAMTGIDHIVLRVVDRERVLAFYRDVLGCAVAKEQPEIGLTQMWAGRSMIDFVTVDGALGRRGGAAPGKDARNLDHVCVGIAPFDEAALRSHLARHGVEVIESGDRDGATGSGPSLYIRDPEGNVVELKSHDSFS